jgi:hypothetical protein
MQGIAQLTGTLRGMVSVTTLFGELMSEIAASDDPDPMLKVPNLPLVPARVAKVPALVAAD